MVGVLYNTFLSADVLKMFPISFERASSHDRVISEENLVSWFRGVAENSADLSKNSKYSYVITDELNSNFAQNSSATNQEFEFMLGGYYIKLSDRGFTDLPVSDNRDIYAVIEETNTEFRHLVDGEDINSDNNSVRALKFVSVDHGESFAPPDPGLYKLHILTKDNGKYSIPQDSLRASFAVDGGEIA